MIKNISYNSRELREEINETVGKSFSLIKRLKLKGIGSQRYVMFDASRALHKLINKDNKTNFCNIELRQKGIILHFRSRLETYGWLVPYRLLSLFKSDNSITIYCGVEFAQLKAAHTSPLNNKFIHKMLRLKSDDTKNFSNIINIY